jgi:hypothetical protein
VKTRKPSLDQFMRAVIEEPPRYILGWLWTFKWVASAKRVFLIKRQYDMGTMKPIRGVKVQVIFYKRYSAQYPANFHTYSNDIEQAVADSMLPEPMDHAAKVYLKLLEGT